MPAGREAIGDGRMYRFSTLNGARAHTACLIDAHGSGTLRNSNFQLPQQVERLIFYTPPRTPLTVGQTRNVRNPDGTRSNYSAGIVEIAIENASAIAAREIPLGGGLMCPNYNLEKINRTSTGCLGGRFSNAFGERGVMSYEDIEQFLTRFSLNVTMDIVTIRNRQFKSDLTLEEAVRTLSREGYTSIHCSFCRVSPIIGVFQSGGTRLSGVPADHV